VVQGQIRLEVVHAREKGEANCHWDCREAVFVDSKGLHLM